MKFGFWTRMMPKRAVHRVAPGTNAGAGWEPGGPKWQDDQTPTWRGSPRKRKTDSDDPEPVDDYMRRRL